MILVLTTSYGGECVGRNRKNITIQLDKCIDAILRKEKKIGKTVRVIVDRPKGGRHPEHPDMIYPINYGYIEGIMAADGEEQDAYILGVDEPISEFVGRVIAVIHRADDVEDKWVVADEKSRYTEEEIRELTYFQEQYFQSTIQMI